MKTTKFTPLRYLIILSIIYIVIPVTIMVMLWVFVGTSIITISVTIFSCGVIMIYPKVLYENRENASIKITSTTIENYINDSTGNSGWIEELVEIQSYKITDCKEGQKYYKNCKAKKILLIDFGNGNVKYIALHEFTKKQIEKILATIEERRKALQNRTSK